MRSRKNRRRRMTSALIRVATMVVSILDASHPLEAIREVGVNTQPMSGEHGRAAGAMVMVETNATNDDWNGEFTTSNKATRRAAQPHQVRQANPTHSGNNRLPLDVLVERVRGSGAAGVHARSTYDDRSTFLPATAVILPRRRRRSGTIARDPLTPATARGPVRRPGPPQRRGATGGTPCLRRR